MNWKKLLFWKAEQSDALLLATGNEQIAREITLRLNHLPKVSKDEILRLVVAKTLENKHIHQNPTRPAA